ncbi:MAG: hypothetical protein WKF73_16445 [Nocardioidaceae bacterium]
MTNRIHREVIGGHLLVIGGAEDKYNERRILRKFFHWLEATSERFDYSCCVRFSRICGGCLCAGIYQTRREKGKGFTRNFTAEVVEADPEVLLDGVTGAFISGGDQMRLTSIMGGTKISQKLRQMVSETNVV